MSEEKIVQTLQALTDDDGDAPGYCQDGPSTVSWGC